MGTVKLPLCIILFILRKIPYYGKQRTGSEIKRNVKINFYHF